MSDIKKDLAGQEDILWGEGSVIQVRNQQNTEVSKVRMIYPSESIAELQQVDPDKFPRVVLISEGKIQFYSWNGAQYEPLAFGTGNLAYDLPEGEVPYYDGTTFQGSGLKFLANGILLAPKGFAVESGSIDFGDSVTVSEKGGFLGLTNKVNNGNYLLVDYSSPRDSAASRPRVLAATQANADYIIQGDYSTELNSGPYNLTYTPDYNAYVNTIKVKTNLPMVNTRITITDLASGVVVKYLPSKQAVLAGEGGIDLPGGDATIDLGNSPLPFTSGESLSVLVEADNYAAMGVSGQPYLVAGQQEAEYRYLKSDGVSYTVTEADSPSQVKPSSDVSVNFTSADSGSSIELALDPGIDVGDTVVINRATNAQGNSLVLNSTSGFEVVRTDGTSLTGVQLTTSSSRRLEFTWSGTTWTLYSER